MSIYFLFRKKDHMIEETRCCNLQENHKAMYSSRNIQQIGGKGHKNILGFICLFCLDYLYFLGHVYIREGCNFVYLQKSPIVKQAHLKQKNIWIQIKCIQVQPQSLQDFCHYRPYRLQDCCHYRPPPPPLFTIL